MNVDSKMNIIVVDLSVKQTSPAGSCVLSELVGLSEHYNVHLIATEADETIIEKVTFHKIDAPSAPLVLRYMLFSNGVKRKMNKIIAEIKGPYIIQTTQGQYVNSSISYPHFCHRAYLQKHWKSSSITGLRRAMRKLNHQYHAREEEKAFRVAKTIVAPSKGLSRELIDTYPFCKDKITIISNPVDIQYYKKPENYKRLEEREKYNLHSDEVIIAFAALGDFARKGLPELMHGLKEIGEHEANFKILVIGGKEREIDTYKELSREMNIENKILFVGFQKDIRPYLWLSDLFALPSTYEIFSLVCVQAAAAGLPLLSTKLHGVEEYLMDGKNGWLVKRDATAIGLVLKAIGKGDYNLIEMGNHAIDSVTKYNHQSFRKKWLNMYANLDL